MTLCHISICHIYMSTCHIYIHMYIYMFSFIFLNYKEKSTFCPNVNCKKKELNQHAFFHSQTEGEERKGGEARRWVGGEEMAGWGWGWGEERELGQRCRDHYLPPRADPTPQCTERRGACLGSGGVVAWCAYDITDAASQCPPEFGWPPGRGLSPL